MSSEEGSVKEYLVESVMALYEGAETSVRTADGITDLFKILVGVHQGSVRSPLQFTTVMGDIRKQRSK